MDPGSQVYISEAKVLGAEAAAAAKTARVPSDGQLVPIAMEPFDPGSRYALEHSGLGPADLFVDSLGLLLAALLVAAAGANVQALDSHADAMFAATFGRLTLCVPIFAAALTSTRRRSLLSPSFIDQVHALAVPVCAGGLLSLAIWQGFFALGFSAPGLDWILAMSALSLTTVSATRVLYHRGRRRRGGRSHRVLIVGSGRVADQLERQMAATAGTEVVGFVDDDPVDAARCLGPLSSLSAICDREDVGHVVVAFSRSKPQEIIDALRPMQGRLPITVVPRLFEVVPSNARMHELGSGFAGLSVPPVNLGPWPRAIKLTMDVCLAAAGLLVLSPFLLLVAVTVRLTSRGPVLFRQSRVGRKGEQFSMLKFRTMYVEGSGLSPSLLDGVPTVGPFPKLKNDPRVTPVGRLLRRTSIDELPQLWNVLKGQMALVGPRPFTCEDAATIAGWALRRYSVRPGITGLWQVSGRNEITFAEMCRLDQLYVNCWSIGLDLRILFRTAWVVLGGQGAY